MLHQPLIAQNYRETREFACESKFLVNADQARLIREWARGHLAVDPHGTGEHGDLYKVDSVYFDTGNLDVYARNGSYGRSKYRVRRYNAGDSVFLERKTKTAAQVSKRRTLLPLGELNHLQQAPQPQWPGYWFQRRLRGRQLQPICHIGYERVARIGQAENGPCRLTLDHAITAQLCRHIVFPAVSGRTLLPSNSYILELKYRYTVPALFRRLISEFSPLPQRISKYRLAIETLGVTSGVSVHREAM